MDRVRGRLKVLKEWLTSLRKRSARQGGKTKAFRFKVLIGDKRGPPQPNGDKQGGESWRGVAEYAAVLEIFQSGGGESTRNLGTREKDRLTRGGGELKIPVKIIGNSIGD